MLKGLNWLLPFMYKFVQEFIFLKKDIMELRKLSVENYSKAQSLLKGLELPFKDLVESSVVLYELKDENSVVAYGGFEYYNNSALLRSVAVSSKFQHKGIGRCLINKIEMAAVESGIKEFYLLTTTAEKFFAKLNYKVISREYVPETVKQSKEFSNICPSTAICMFKKLI